MVELERALRENSICREPLFSGLHNPEEVPSDQFSCMHTCAAIFPGYGLGLRVLLSPEFTAQGDACPCVGVSTAHSCCPEQSMPDILAHALRSFIAALSGLEALMDPAPVLEQQHVQLLGSIH